MSRDAYRHPVRAHERLHGQFSALFRAYGLTQAQYNVLRILRGAPTEGASCQYVGERLLNRLPDVMRLIDRMKAAGLVTREFSAEDRRVVLIRSTPRGRKICKSLDGPVMELHREQSTHLDTANSWSFRRCSARRVHSSFPSSEVIQCSRLSSSLDFSSDWA